MKIIEGLYFIFSIIIVVQSFRACLQINFLVT